MPDYFDPCYQEERRQAEWDAFLERCPKCSACGAAIHPGTVMRKITVKKEELTFCEDCIDELEESEEIYYEE